MARRMWLAGLLMLGVFALDAGSAMACPSCRAANSTDNRLPRAYQYSILFMLAVPGVLVTSFGVGLYRLNKVQEEALAAFENGDVWSEDPDA
jgi:hypothetical protein